MAGANQKGKMNEDKHVIIHFNNGSKMELSIPLQVKNSTAVVLEGIKKVMETDKLIIEAEGRLYVIPWSSVKLVELSSLPAALPFGAIKGAKVLTQ